MSSFTCIKANDIGGRLGTELNEDIVYRIGCAYEQFFDARRVAIGGDMRLSFRDFAYCDSGMSSWLLVVELISYQGREHSEFVGSRNGEVNYTDSNSRAMIATAQAQFAIQTPKLGTVEGLILEFNEW